VEERRREKEKEKKNAVENYFLQLLLFFAIRYLQIQSEITWKKPLLVLLLVTHGGKGG
jgi:hypothetical protein